MLPLHAYQLMSNRSPVHACPVALFFAASHRYACIHPCGVVRALAPPLGPAGHWCVCGVGTCDARRGGAAAAVGRRRRHLGCKACWVPLLSRLQAGAVPVVAVIAEQLNWLPGSRASPVVSTCSLFPC
eukprot:6209382-Pleurochrysis_carterae.AAC.1